MIAFIHQWLISHPITQSLLIGVAFVIPALYAKEIRAFLEMPPQKLGTRWRQARESAKITSLYQLNRARSDMHYLLYRCTSSLTTVVVLLSLPLIQIGVVTSQLMYPSSRTARLANLFDKTWGGRLGSELAIVIPIYMAMFEVYRFWRFTHRLANFDETDLRLSKQIEHLEAKMASPEHQQDDTSGNDPVLQSTLKLSQVQQAKSPATPSGTSEGPIQDLKVLDLVRHPKYGDGKVRRIEGDGVQAVVTVDFYEHGPKKLVLKYARLSRKQ